MSHHGKKIKITLNEQYSDVTEDNPLAMCAMAGIQAQWSHNHTLDDFEQLQAMITLYVDPQDFELKITKSSMKWRYGGYESHGVTVTAKTDTKKVSASFTITLDIDETYQFKLNEVTF